MKDHPSQWLHSGLTCRDVTARASDYLDDQSPFLTKIRVGLHLASCVHCRTYVMQLGLVRDAVALLPRQYPSAINRLRLRQHFSAHHSRESLDLPL